MKTLWRIVQGLVVIEAAAWILSVTAYVVYITIRYVNRDVDAGAIGDFVAGVSVAVVINLVILLRVVVPEWKRHGKV